MPRRQLFDRFAGPSLRGKEELDQPAGAPLLNLEVLNEVKNISILGTIAECRGGSRHGGPKGGSDLLRSPSPCLRISGQLPSILPGPGQDLYRRLHNPA